MTRLAVRNRWLDSTAFDHALQLALRLRISTGQTCALIVVSVHPWWTVDTWFRGSPADARQKIGDQLAGVLYEGDTICERADGEWMVLLLDVTGPEEALAVGERLTQIATAADESDSGHRVSAGVAVASGLYRRASSLIGDARVALSRAIERGAGTVEIFEERSRLDVLHRLREIDRVERGITRSEFELHFQPIVDVRSRTVRAVEALLRPNGANPAGDAQQLVAVAEETDRIDRLGAWVLAVACRHARTWADRGIVTHVNISPIHLRNRRLLDDVESALEQSGLAPELLAVEITESATVDPRAVKHIVALKQMGVGVSLDDFGTGYANLSSLRDLPIDIVKLDRSLIKGIESNSPTAAMVEAVTAMAHALGLAVVAEGVETADEFAVVAECECDLVQGFHLDRPMHVDRLTEAIDDDGRSAE